MAISTAKTYLMYESAPATFTKLLDIISYPDMGGAPNKIDTTDLSATKMKTFINGLMEAPDLTFEANYDEAVYTTISAMAGLKDTFQLHFGTAGVDGKFQWEGIPIQGSLASRPIHRVNREEHRASH
jgi:hypothetical protein